MLFNFRVEVFLQQHKEQTLEGVWNTVEVDTGELLFIKQKTASSSLKLLNKQL